MDNDEVFRATPSARPDHPFAVGAVGVDDTEDVVQPKHFVGFIIGLIGSIFTLVSVAPSWAAKSLITATGPGYSLQHDPIYIGSSFVTVWLYILVPLGLITMISAILLLISHMIERVNIGKKRLAFFMFSISCLVILFALIGMALVMPEADLRIGGGLAVSGGALTLISSMFFGSLGEMIRVSKRCISIVKREEAQTVPQPQEMPMMYPAAQSPQPASQQPVQLPQPQQHPQPQQSRVQQPQPQSRPVPQLAQSQQQPQLQQQPVQQPARSTTTQSPQGQQQSQPSLPEPRHQQPAPQPDSQHPPLSQQLKRQSPQLIDTQTEEPPPPPPPPPPPQANE